MNTRGTGLTLRRLTSAGQAAESSHKHWHGIRHSFSSDSKTHNDRQKKSIMKTFLKISVLGFAAALLTCGPLAAADSMTETLRPLKGAEFEQSFLTQMIHHHQEGIEMAKMVPHHTKRAELTDFAEKMTKTQTAEMEKMSALLKSPAGSSAAPMDHSMMGDKKREHSAMGEKKMDHAKMDGTKMSGMGGMESAQGAEFDRMFVQHMIKHHTSALEMAQLAEGRASRPEVIAFAEKLSKEQKDEIQKLKNWESKWNK
jgi:uncharacterized protein (DUF305 family)